MFNKPLLPISVVADVLKVHQRTLRIYDEEDILVPKRSPKNRRLYSQADIETGKFVQYLTKEMAINLAGIKIITKLLAKLGVEPSQRISFVHSIAEELGINADKQAENKARLSKRGRKPRVLD